MFSSLQRKLRFLLMLTKNIQREPSQTEPVQQNLSAKLTSNLTAVQRILGSSIDVVIRRFRIGSTREVNAAIIFIDGLVNKSLLNENILRPLMVDWKRSDGNDASTINPIEFAQSNMITIGDIRCTNIINDVVAYALDGNAVLLIDGSTEALILGTGDWEARKVEEPETEVVVRGPREGFTETLRINIALLRRAICNPNLTFETMKLGKQTRREVCIAYLKGVTNNRLVSEIKRRLQKIDTDAILESGYIEEFIEDAPFSPFATIANTERPDRVAAKILEGRAAILVDGTPIVLTVPMLFVESFQSPEDYYSRPYYSSFVRLMRYFAFTLSVLAPAAYVALTTFHQELIPTSLLITMVAAREGKPFPAVLEAFMMGLIFEVLREAGVRLPRPVGQAVSIVGALVIGEAAVSAGLIGAPMVIVIAVTAISSFVVPAQTDSAVMLRAILTILAGVLGAFGMIIGLLGVLIHLASLRSFGAPYLSPLAPLSIGDLKDVLIRAPLWAMFTRPRAIGWHDPQRQEFRLMPTSPQDGER